MARAPIYYAPTGMVFYAVLRRNAQLNVWIENHDGSPYSNFIVSAPWLNLPSNEFVADTHCDAGYAMATAMLSTGWFESTGQSVSMPNGHVCEVWRLTPNGEAWLAKTGQSGAQGRKSKTTIRNFSA